jgi:16S rRNA (guanine966-N2)-methyltransferase
MIRLTGGEFRGRAILIPKGPTRPTQSKLRQALLNSLQMQIPDASVLDLFAGSGALGFEALSRGAKDVVFCESGRQAHPLILKNAETLGVGDRVKVIADPLLTTSSIHQIDLLGPFDVVFADPPYKDQWEEKLPKDAPWERWLKPDGVFCLEWGVHQSRKFVIPDQVGVLVKVREKIYGDSVLTTFKRAEATS